MTAGDRKRERLWRAIVARTAPAASDLELLDRWRAGELAAGEELSRRHAGTLRGFFATKCATKCGGHDGELARRTLLACVRAEGPPPVRSSFRTYLFTLARRELYGYLQQRHRGRQLDFAIASVADLLAAEGGDERS
jgi:RNA polymerase sigma-70 factor (ECF subfamily)